MQRRAKIQKKAFTPIDMLAVMAITALSLSVFMPSLQKAREQARNAACISNLHSWGASFSLYGNDWNQKVCPALVMYVSVIVAWDETLRRYYVDDKIRLCASAEKLSTVSVGSGNSYIGSKNSAWHLNTSHRDGTIYHVTGSYGMNIYADYPVPSVWEPAGSQSLLWHWGRLTVKNGREIPILGDCDWREAWPSNTDRPRATENGNVNSGIDHFNMRRHTRSVNLVFYDSSVRHLLLPDLWKLRWNRNSDPNQSITTFPAWMTN